MTVPHALRIELRRKALHLCTAVVPLLLATGRPQTPLIASLGVLVLVALLVELVRRRWAWAGRVFHRFVGSMLRPHEAVRFSGATWLLIALFVSVWLFPRRVAILATWAASIGDAAAALVGHTFGKRKTAASGKSILGSAACAVATMLGGLFIGQSSLSICIIAGLAAAASEWPSRPFDDNLRIALVTGLCVLAGGAVLT